MFGGMLLALGCGGAPVPADAAPPSTAAATPARPPPGVRISPGPRPTICSATISPAGTRSRSRDFRAAATWLDKAIAVDPDAPELISRTFLMEVVRRAISTGPRRWRNRN